MVLTIPKGTKLGIRDRRAVPGGVQVIAERDIVVDVRFDIKALRALAVRASFNKRRFAQRYGIIATVRP